MNREQKNCLAMCINFSSLFVSQNVFRQFYIKSVVNSVNFFHRVSSEAAVEANSVCAKVIARVKNQIEKHYTGRLFAVVHVAGKQFKVTQGDLIVLQGHWTPAVGERIKLEKEKCIQLNHDIDVNLRSDLLCENKKIMKNKVLMVGSSDFSLIGRPILSPDSVSVESTVVEKALSHTRTVFRHTPRKNNRLYRFSRLLMTTLRINHVQLKYVDSEDTKNLAAVRD